MIRIALASVLLSGCVFLGGPHVALESECTALTAKGQKAEYGCGTIDQETSLVLTKDGWVKAWWFPIFTAAKAKGCDIQDSCGVFPPYYMGAQYCGEPIEVCPGSSWRAEHNRIWGAR